MTRSHWIAASAAGLVALCAVGIAPAAETGGAGDVAAEAVAPNVLHLEEAVSLALRHHPRLSRGSWRVQQESAQSKQAARRPNPELGLELEDFGGTGAAGGFGSSVATFSLSQRFELFGKRDRRIEEAELRRDHAEWDARAARIDVVSETTRAFVAVLASQERVALADTLVGVAEEALASVARRVRAGAVSATEERRARVALETSRVDREHAVRARDAARFRLSSAWGEPSPTFARVVGSLALPVRAEELGLPALLSRLETSPRMARFTSEAEHARAVRSLAQSMGSPDVSVGAGVRRIRESGETAFLVEGAFPLPLFDRNRDAVEAADAGIRILDAEARAVAIEMQVAIAEAHAARAASEHEAVALTERILPEAESAFVETREAYERGRLRLTDVLDAERTVFELRRRRLDALETVHVASVEIERILGQSLSGDPDLEGER